MKATLTQEMKRIVRKTVDGIKVLETEPIPAGTEIDHPKCYLLVKQGVAVPADSECEIKANMTPEKTALAKKAYEKISKGIHPEDYEAFDRGLMTGYDPNGKAGDSWLHGPNWAPGCEEEYYDQTEEDDDDE